MTVLVVDDEEGVRMLARRILESAGYAVLEAKNGAEGLKVIEANTPVDLLMADLDMPVMRGEDMAVRIRAACGSPAAISTRIRSAKP